VHVGFVCNEPLRNRVLGSRSNLQAECERKCLDITKVKTRPMYKGNGVNRKPVSNWLLKHLFYRCTGVESGARPTEKMAKKPVVSFHACPTIDYKLKQKYAW
jgi:hypothetical protein